MDDRTLDLRLRMASVAAVLVVVVLGILSWVAVRALFDSARRGAAAQTVLLKIESITTLIQDVESGSRGYILTSKPMYLEPYYAAFPGLEAGIVELKRLTQDDTAQRQAADRLESLVADKLAFHTELVRTHDELGREAALQHMIGDAGNRIMDELRALALRMEQRELDDLAAFSADRANSYRLSIVLIFVGYLVATLLLVFAAVNVTAELQRRRRAQAELREANERLEGRVAERTRALTLANDSLAEEAQRHRRTAEALRESEARYRLLTENFPEGAVLLYDRERRSILADGRGLANLGHTRASVEGRTLDEVFAGEIAGSFKPLCQAALEGRPTTVELPHRERTLMVQNHPVLDRAGRIVGGLCIMQDITSRRALEDRLLQSQKMQVVGQLAGGVAHDFNNVLMVILANTEQAIRAIGVDHPAFGYLTTARHATDSAAKLTQQLLAISRQQVLQPQPVDLTRLAARMAAILGRSLGARISVETELRPDVGLIRADPSQIEQVILNLCINARDAMPDGGRLTIRTATVDPQGPGLPPGLKPGAYVTLQVSDTGQGMDAATQRRIFEPFFTTKADRGAGLGLATVHGIVEQSGGVISVQSAPGRGSTFTVYFPRLAKVEVAVELKGARGAAAPPPQAPRPAPVTVAAPGEVAVVVDDEPLVRDVITATLTEAGFEVLSAGDGQSALELLERTDRPVSLLVTDWVMPGMTGRELARTARRARPGLPVVYATGYAPTQLMNESDLLPYEAFLQKPFNTADLLTAIARIRAATHA